MMMMMIRNQSWMKRMRMKRQQRQLGLGQQIQRWKEQRPSELRQIQMGGWRDQLRGQRMRWRIERIGKQRRFRKHQSRVVLAYLAS